MKSLGVIRRIDVLGRIVLPKEIRDAKNWDDGTPMEIYMDGDKLILKEYKPGCVFCGAIHDSEEMTQFGGKLVCPKCVGTIRETYKPKMKEKAGA